jgi:hypothetical protein
LYGENDNGKLANIISVASKEKKVYNSGTINYTTLNPPIVSQWVGTATSDLNMAGYDIKTTVGTLDLINATNTINLDGTAVHLKVTGADQLVADGTEVAIYKDLDMTTNDITNVDTITATTVVATTAKATNTQLVDSGNQVIELKKSAGINYPVYSAPASGVATASILDDTNNKPTLSFDSATDVLTLSAKDVAGNAVVLSTVDISTTLDDYIPLAGTESGKPVTGAVVFENSANLQCLDLQTGLISALPTVSFISIEDPVQTRILGVRSEDGSVPARILMALSESAVAPDILQMSYDPAGADALEVNKDIISNGVNLNNAIAFKDANEFFVSSNGSDTTGNGSANAPYATIQKAITEAEANAGDNRVINIMAGGYGENITLTKGSIILTGNFQSDRAIEGVVVSGKITVNITDTDNLNNNQIILEIFDLLLINFQFA